MFSTNPGKFLYYEGTNGAKLGYLINTLPDIKNGGGIDQDAIAAGTLTSARIAKNPLVVAAVAAIIAVATVETVVNLKDGISIIAPSFATGGFLLNKTADELISPSLKKSPSYNPNYGDYTIDELAELAKKGDIIAK